MLFKIYLRNSFLVFFIRINIKEFYLYTKNKELKKEDMAIF